MFALFFIPYKKLGCHHIGLPGLGITKQAVNKRDDYFFVFTVQPLNARQPGKAWICLSFHQ